MTRKDAGRMGGNKTKERYGSSDFFSRIGEQGGRARGKSKRVVYEAFPTHKPASYDDSMDFIKTEDHPN